MRNHILFATALQDSCLLTSGGDTVLGIIDLETMVHTTGRTDLDKLAKSVLIKYKLRSMQFYFKKNV